MPSFLGRRVNRTNGAGAGRGDNPYPGVKAPVPPPLGGPRGSGSGRMVIGGSGGASTEPNRVPDTKAARKANSPKAKAKALKAVNKNPLTPSDSFASDAGFERSDEAFTYDSARIAESSLKRNTYKDMPKNMRGLAGRTASEQRDDDEDTVGAYVATGKSKYSTEGQKWMKENSADTRRKRYG